MSAADTKEEEETTSNVAIDNSVKDTVQKIPLLTIRAGPRDGAQWTERLKQELNALIKVVEGRMSIGIIYICMCVYDAEGESVRWDSMCSITRRMTMIGSCWSRIRPESSEYSSDLFCLM